MTWPQNPLEAEIDLFSRNESASTFTVEEMVEMRRVVDAANETIHDLRAKLEAGRGAHAIGYAEGRKAERAAVVAFMRKTGNEPAETVIAALVAGTCESLARHVERGAHVVKEGPDA